jgi:hypothetical protein
MNTFSISLVHSVLKFDDIHTSSQKNFSRPPYQASATGLYGWARRRTRMIRRPSSHRTTPKKPGRHRQLPPRSELARDPLQAHGLKSIFFRVSAETKIRRIKNVLQCRFFLRIIAL